MPRIVVATVLVLAVLMTTSCTSGGGGEEPPLQPGGTEEDLDSATAEPTAELEGSCEPLPQRDADGHYLTADLVARNTGNIGIVVRVVATWRQPGGNRVAASKRLRLDLDQSTPVALRIDVGEREARGVERMVERDRGCFTRVSIAGAFGAPRE